MADQKRSSIFRGREEEQHQKNSKFLLCSRKHEAGYPNSNRLLVTDRPAGDPANLFSLLLTMAMLPFMRNSAKSNRSDFGDEMRIGSAECSGSVGPDRRGAALAATPFTLHFPFYPGAAHMIARKSQRETDPSHLF